MYRPRSNFDVPMKLLIPKWKEVNGVPKKVFPKLEDDYLFFGSFKTYGGTETTVNGILSVEDTAWVETWFMPEITSECHIIVMNGMREYSIIGEPENIEERFQFMKFKVKRVKGKA